MDTTGCGHPADQETLRIQMLGDFRISCGLREIPNDAWRLRNADRLVKILALTSDHRLHREEIFDALWPDLDPGAAANNLRYTIYVARRVLRGVTDAELFPRTGEQISLASVPIEVDAEVFAFQARVAQDSRDPADYRRAVALYGGDLLPGDIYEDWTAQTRESLRMTYLSLLIELAELDEQAGDLGSAVSLLQQAIDIDHAYEDAHVRLMRLFARRGQRQRALRQYAMLQSALRQELDVDPDPESQRLYQDLKAERNAASTPIEYRNVADEQSHAFASQRNHNLPVPLTSFIGRDKAIAQIRERLGTARLITLIGPGGSGKSRLAFEVARGLLDAFSDGVWVVELGAISDPQLVVRSVAATLKVTEQPTQPLMDTLGHVLADRNLLILLDNCEHLLAECAELAHRLLATAPNVRILATSREKLHVGGELIWRVKPLAVPDSRHPLPPADLARIEAVQLFSERTALVHPEFEITSENAGAVSAICKKLDGIPLAIELAAARVAVLPPAQLATRLDDALRVLIDGNWTTVPRHRTLRATLDWSYGLLSDEEQILLQRMSVFRNGCTLDAATEICGWREVDSHNVLHFLGQLVDKSLVVVDLGEQQARYRLLAVVQQYARERLDDRSETERLSDRHAEYFLKLTETTAPNLVGAQQGEWFDGLANDLANVRAALAWLKDTNLDHALRLAAALGRFWWARGYYSEGADWLTWLVNHDDLTPNGSAYMTALSWASLITFRQGDFHAAQKLAQQQLSVARETGDAGDIAWALLNLSMVTGELGDHRGELQLLEESLPLFEQVNDTAGVAHVLNSLAEMARHEHDLERSVRLYQESLDLLRTLGDQQYIGRGLHNLGRVLLLQGKHQRAACLLAEALVRFNELGTKNGVALCLSGLGGVAVETGRFEQAARLLGAAEGLRRSLGVVEDSLDRAQSETARDTACAALGETAFTAALDAGVSRPVDDTIAEALAFEAEIQEMAMALTTDTPQLSPREREVATLVADGYTNAQIASTLDISKRTADTHVSRILRKLGVNSRNDLPQWVRDPSGRSG